MNQNKGRIVIVSSAVLFLACCCLSFFGMREQKPSIKQVCLDLEIPLDDPLCQQSDSLHALLSRSFKIGETTREQVNAALGKYLVTTRTRPIGTISETYAFNRNMFNSVLSITSPTHYFFDYTDDEVLFHIGYQD